MKSIWEMTEEISARECLNGNKKVDVAVIGAGMTGILTAWFLKQKGARVLVLEGSRIGMGATAHTTAKVTSSHNLIYDKLIRRFGVETARKYGELQEMAIEAYASLIREEKIVCRWERRPSYIYTRKTPQLLEQEARAAARLGLPVQLTDRTELPFSVKAALRYGDQAQFHPLAFLKGIARELAVCEDTWVRGVKGRQVFTDRGTVIADQIVIATHYPFLNAPGYYFLREYQKKSYLLALKQAQKIEGMYIGAGTEGYSFRPFGELLLFGGEGSRTGKNTDGLPKLKDAARKLYPRSRVVCGWVNQDGMTMDGLPYVGKYSAKIPNLYTATGYGKWGMSNSMAAALLLSKELSGETWDYSGIFSPQRKTVPAAWPEYLIHGWESAVNLSMGLFRPAVGKTADGPGKDLKCSHLGCRLTWNEQEKVYECPCHGSKFDRNGRRIAGPAPKERES